MLTKWVNVKAVVTAFNQEKALVGAFSVIVKCSWLLFLLLTHLVCQLAGVESVPHHGAGGGQDEAVSPHQDPATGQDGQV